MIKLIINLLLGCVKQAFIRKMGDVPRFCGSGYEKKDNKCYPLCPENFSAIGEQCIKNCPEDYTENGEACLKPSTYGRGTGYFLWNKDKCIEENPEGCEKWGLFWYPKCREGYKNFGCCICTPECPENMEEKGGSCMKYSIPRGEPKPLSCSANEDFFRGFCFFKCPSGLQSDGPVCLKSCPNDKSECGWFCMRNRYLCGNFYTQFREDKLPLLIEISKEQKDLTKIDLLKTVQANFELPICE